MTPKTISDNSEPMSETGWIAVTDRLPTEGQSIYWVHPDLKTTVTGTFRFEHGNGWFFCRGPFNCMASEVEWWMPRPIEVLPEPPKEPI